MNVKKKINNMEKTDCTHFSWATVPFCCGRMIDAGKCELGSQANNDFRMCSTNAPYCKYEKIKTEVIDDVHPTQLPDPNV